MILELANTHSSAANEGVFLVLRLVNGARWHVECPSSALNDCFLVALGQARQPRRHAALVSDACEVACLSRVQHQL